MSEGNLRSLPHMAQLTLRFLNLRGPIGSPSILMVIGTSLYPASSVVIHGLYLGALMGVDLQLKPPGRIGYRHFNLSHGCVLC